MFVTLLLRLYIYLYIYVYIDIYVYTYSILVLYIVSSNETEFFMNFPGIWLLPLNFLKVLCAIVPTADFALISLR